MSPAAMELRTGIDVLMGIGGAPEAVLAACGVTCIGGGMQARLWLREGEREILEREGKREGDVLDIDDLVAGENVFFAATGITDGELLQGVRYLGDGRSHTQSLVMRSYSGTTRYIEAEHRLDKLRRRRDLMELASKGHLEAIAD
jgi:fructose-1,6-bisphosphatase II